MSWIDMVESIRRHVYECCFFVAVEVMREGLGEDGKMTESIWGEALWAAQGEAEEEIGRFSEIAGEVFDRMGDVVTAAERYRERVDDYGDDSDEVFEREWRRFDIIGSFDRRESRRERMRR